MPCCRAVKDSTGLELAVPCSRPWDSALPSDPNPSHFDFLRSRSVWAEFCTWRSDVKTALIDPGKYLYAFWKSSVLWEMLKMLSVKEAQDRRGWKGPL